MNKKSIKYIITSLVIISCLSTISKTTMADTISYSINDLEFSNSYSHNHNNQDEKKDKHKGFNVFSKENSKYLSSDQNKKLLELKKCEDNGEKLSKEQHIILHSIIDCIIKGKLGNEDYEDFKCLIEKSKSSEKLTQEEEKKLKEYKDIIDGSKLSNKEMLNQFLR